MITKITLKDGSRYELSVKKIMLTPKTIKILGGIMKNVHFGKPIWITLSWESIVEKFLFFPKNCEVK